MNYRHAFHAGNHADVLKHVLLLALCDALTQKPAACFALDTHAGRGLYRLDAAAALQTGEAAGGIGRLMPGDAAPIDRYLDAVAACRQRHGDNAYPGSPWLLAHALREQDRIACCEIQSEDHAVLAKVFAGDARVMTHARDGYAAVKALLPPKLDGQRFGRGLVLIDPPYEAQLAEFDAALGALRDGLARWPQAVFALWYPIKRHADLARFYRRAAALEAKSALVAELLVRAGDSPLRLNGSGMLVLNGPWRFERCVASALPALRKRLADGPGDDAGMRWLREPA